MLFNLAVLPLIVSLAGSAVAAPHRMDASLMARKKSDVAAASVADDSSADSALAGALAGAAAADNSTATASVDNSTASSVDNSTVSAGDNSTATAVDNSTAAGSVTTVTVTVTEQAAATGAAGGKIENIHSILNPFLIHGHEVLLRNKEIS
jgi:hypothetical protein